MSFLGVEFAQPALFTALDLVLHGVFDAAAGVGDRQQPHSAVGAMAMGFHFVDYVVHGWDVAASLGVPYHLPADVVDAVRPLALAVPDGDFRAVAGAPFAPAVQQQGTGDFAQILRHLGRRPDWDQRYSTVTGAWSDQRNA